MNGRGRHFEHKIWFFVINQVQPTLFLKNLSFIKVKGDLATETNEDNDSLLWYILWSFCASLNIYVTHRGQLKYLVMFSFWWNVTSNWAQMLIIVIFTCYVCCFQTGWHYSQTWLVFRSLNACIEFKIWKDSFANQCSHDVYVYKHRTAL